MTTPLGYDHDSIFQFDPETSPDIPSVSDISGHDDDHFLTDPLAEPELILSSSPDKGKGVTKSLFIELMSPTDSELEFASLFDSASTSLSPPRSAPLSQLVTSPFICTFPANEDLYPQSWQLGCDNVDSGKGKGKELSGFEAPPVFDLPELEDSHLEYSVWSSPRSPTPGPSHQGSPTYSTSSPPSIQGHSAPIDNEASTSSLHTQNDQPALKHMPSRRHSLSNLSLFTTKSQSMLRTKMKWNVPRIQSNLSRSLFFKKQKEAEDKTALSEPFDPSILQYPNDALQKVLLDDLPGKSSDQPILRTKGRSQSLPEPLSALDYVPTSTLDIYEPIPLIIKNYFDDELPRELRLRIFKSLLDLHVLDFQRLVASGKWSVARASSSKGQWVGRDRGRRELFKLSRVSKSWQSLVFDGQLWTSFDLTAFPALSESALLRLSQSGCSFARSLNLAGHFQLHSNVFMNIVDNLCISPRVITRTQLTTINLQGCSSLTAPSLHHLLVLSDSLQTINLKGLNAVTNSTCKILSTNCPLVTNLNMSRCPNMDAEGIQYLASAALRQGTHLKLKTLRVSGLKNISDGMMAALGKAAPLLEVLDLSYARQLHNSAIEAFVSCEPDDLAEDLGVDVISLTAREVGRETGNRDRYLRRVTRLRHVNFSYCILLTDVACFNLARSVPHLEFIELAGIGTDLKDDGLIRLFRTTPHIRRIDLEDASDITDDLLGAITPITDTNTARDSKSSPQPGHALERLIISHANHISDTAFLNLIQSCSRLTCLEADNTRMSAAVLREFVQLSRGRNISNARIVAVDCRGINDGMIKELSGSIRPRMGWRSHAARKLMYLDSRDEDVEELKIGQDECDEKRVVVKSFYTWQTVDAVSSAREKRRKSTKRVNNDGSDFEDSSWRTRWWSPSGRRAYNSGRDTPQSLTDSSDGCQVM